MVEGGSRQLRDSALRSILAAALLGVAAASVSRAVFDLDWRFVARVAALLCGGTVLLLWRLSAHHPFDRLGIANQVTLARALLVVLLAAFLGTGTAVQLQTAAFYIASIAAILDAVDGWLARRTGMSSAYGARFDMETDALLILVLSLLVWQFGKAGFWVLGSGLMRYVFVTASVFLPWLKGALPPRPRRKVVAALQTILLLVAIAPVVPPAASNVACAVGLTMLAASFLLDIAWLRRRATTSPAAN